MNVGIYHFIDHRKGRLLRIGYNRYPQKKQTNSSRMNTLSATIPSKRF